MIIAVIGNYDPPPHVYALAEGVGKELARRGITLVCGGLTGVMEAVCKGAKSENGTTIGILPGGSPRTANEWVDFPVATNMGFARNVAVVSTGQAVIAPEDLPGLAPGAVVVMNPIYRGEVAAQVAGLGLTAEILVA